MKHLAFLFFIILSLSACKKKNSDSGNSNNSPVTTNGISNVTSSSAKSGGVVTFSGSVSVSAKGVCWSTVSNPTVSDSKTDEGANVGSFTSVLSGLTPNTTYYTRAYAITSAGTYYGNEVSFNTLTSIPVVTTTAISGIGSTTAISGGLVISDGGSSVTSRGVCWGTTTNPTTSNSKTVDGSDVGSFTSSLTGLNPNTTYYVRAYAINSSGTAYGNQLSFKTSAAIESVTIGTQTWMLKNLDVTTYRNGDPIPQVTDPTQWANLTTGAWCYYNNDPANGPIYGKMYNWFAVNDPRGLAPTGWHVPTNSEWTSLENYLGGYLTAGGKMKTTGTALWQAPNTGATNSSGFTALPGGIRDENGVFFNMGIGAYWWSSTQYGSSGAWGRSLGNTSSEVYNGYPLMQTGFYVRCVKN